VDDQLILWGKGHGRDQVMYIRLYQWSVLCFVKMVVNEKEPPLTMEEEVRYETQEDVDIIDNALSFVNDLLWNMLNMHDQAAYKGKY
jgi:hypothetical protein